MQLKNEAFINTNQFLVLDPWKDSFNYHLSSMRQCIERAFGILTKQWGIFWRPLQCRFDKWPLICTVAATLHTFCIEMREGEEGYILPRLDKDNFPGEFPHNWFNENENDSIINRPNGDSRREITFFLKEKQFRDQEKKGH